MRPIAAFVLTLSSLAIGLMPARPTLAAPADAADVAGAWKVVLMPFGEDEFAIVDLKAVDGKLAATVTSANDGILGPVKSAEASLNRDRIAVKLSGESTSASFSGTLDKGATSVKGSIKLGMTTYPARIERTEAKAVAKLGTSPIRQKLAQIQGAGDAKEKVAKTLELIAQNPGHPMNAAAYAQVFALAEPAGLPPEEVGKLVEKWFDESKLFGADWAADIQGRALKALQGKKTYAMMATDLALAADKALPADASTELKSDRANMLARSAKLAGKEDLAKEAEGRAKEFDGKLDAEYHEKVPPYKPEVFAGRSGGKGNRVVLMEIFTGAECPPCVAADVGFDGLLKTYKPTEFIGLQHHLHIPGPDPLTNVDTVTRAAYYGKEVTGTPSTFFNGKSQAGGGGGMANSEGKYKQFRSAIEPTLDAEKKADIKVTATRAGDEVKIQANATTGEASKGTQPRLRLVLVEESIRYPGGNKLRFHHNVVRAFPGGVAGKEMENGAGSMDVTVRLSDLRKAQDEYLTQYPTSPRGRAFPNALPPMDLDDLAVVAMVQDDADHSIWHAVQVPVEAVTP